jgi:M6 family metalloprotease-like protein
MSTLQKRSRCNDIVSTHYPTRAWNMPELKERWTLPVAVAAALMTTVVWSAPDVAPQTSSTLPATSPATMPATRPLVDLPGFRTVATAEKATLRKAASSSTSSQPGFLGISTAAKGTATVVDHVDPNSPAATAGIAVGDEIRKLNEKPVDGPAAIREALLATPAGDTVRLVVASGNAEREVPVVLAPVSRPLRISPVRVVMGVQLREATDEGVEISRVTADQPAERAGLKPGDMITRIDDAAVGAMATLSDLLASYSPGDQVTVHYRRDGEIRQVRVRLTADTRTATDVRAYTPSMVFKKDVYRMAVIGIEFPDAKPNEKVPTTAWEDMLFSTGTYNTRNATGQTVYGSVNDYLNEVSCGKLKLEGKMYDWVQVAKNRSEYAAGSGDRRLLNEALELLIKREGPDVLKGVDGLMFLYAGGRMQTNRGNVFWPHKGLMIHQNRRHTYFICHDGGERQNNISTFVHEFGHMLGLPDLYARPENPGSEGLWQWCLMSNQITNGRPQHMSAWCKEQLGWLTPTVIDPTVRQKLVLSPINGSTSECFKVLARADGSEYFLLEVRKKTGFDTDLPGEGLLIWRVVRGRPMLEESHGVEGPLGPRSFLRAVPFPTASNRAFTPYTTPSSRSQLGGGLPVFITDIQRLPDGRVTFSIGYETY